LLEASLFCLCSFNASRLETEATAWAESRNAKGAEINWQFTTADARIKLKKLYPSIEV